MKLRKPHLFVLGAMTIVGGGLLSKYIDAAAGAALVAAGGWLIGRVQSEWLPEKKAQG